MLRVGVYRRGEARLRLADGPVPHYREIVQLGGAVLRYMVEELGTRETLRRLADPVWYSALACALGFEWQFSGATTVVLKALSEVSEKEDMGIKIVGGKGKEARVTEKIPEELRWYDRVTTKQDAVSLQDGYSIYFHSIAYDEDGRWVVINQGMNVEKRLARRYHWSWESPLEEEGNAVVGVPEEVVLDLRAKRSRETRRAMLDIVQDESPRSIVYKILSLSREPGQKTLVDFGLPGEKIQLPFHLKIPKKISERALMLAKDAENYLDLINTPGMGPATVRGLAYLAALIYGVQPSWKDPIFFTFAFGTKVGVPYMVQREEMRKAAKFLLDAVQEGPEGMKRRALRRLSKLLEIDSQPSRE